MDKAVIYIHGKDGNAEEAIHYKPLFSNCDVIGLDYTAQFPWEAKEEFPLLFRMESGKHISSHFNAHSSPMRIPVYNDNSTPNLYKSILSRTVRVRAACSVCVRTRISTSPFLTDSLLRLQHTS